MLPSVLIKPANFGAAVKISDRTGSQHLAWSQELLPIGEPGLAGALAERLREDSPGRSDLFPLDVLADAGHVGAGNIVLWYSGCSGHFVRLLGSPAHDTATGSSAEASVGVT